MSTSPEDSSAPAAAAPGSPNSSAATARLLVVIAAILWSTSGFFAKAPTFDDWPGPALAFWRAVFACLILFPMVRRPQFSWRLAPAALTFVLMNYTFLTAIELGSAANAIWLQSTAPVWVLFVGVLFLGEKAAQRDYILIAFAGAGMALILGFELLGQSPTAVLYGLASSLFYAGVVLSLRMMRDLESSWLVAINHLATALALSLWGLTSIWKDWFIGAEPASLAGWLLSSVHDAPWPSGVQWLLLAGFGMLQMGLPYALFARSVQLISGHEAAGIGLLEPLLAPVWVCLVWGIEKNMPAWWTLVGGGLIFMGLVLRYLRRA